MNGVSHMLPFVIGGGILIALAFLFDDYIIDPSNFGKNTPLAAFFKTTGDTVFGFMLPILAGYISMSISDHPGVAVVFPSLFSVSQATYVLFPAFALLIHGWRFSWIFLGMYALSVSE